MILVHSFPAHINLLPLTTSLWSQAIAHQVIQNKGQQLWIVDAQYLSQAQVLLHQFIDGKPASQTEAITSVHKASVMSGITRVYSTIKVSPAVCLVLVISACLAWLSSFGRDETWVAWLSFFPLEWVVNAHFDANFQPPGDGHYLWSQPWRLISPIWLHFGWLHLVFNGLWCWDLGRRIETQQSSGHVLVVMFISALAGNLAQAWHGVVLFGGLSGVVYGLLGYIGLWNWLNPHAKTKFYVPRAVFIFMLVWLFLGFSQLFSLIGLGSIANLAHVGGLIGGCMWAYVVTLHAKYVKSSSVL